jgi:hypothetical protein
MSRRTPLSNIRKHSILTKRTLRASSRNDWNKGPAHHRAFSDIGPEERDEIERLLEKIEAALDLLDTAGPSGR